jgi:hypothetical protein
MLLVSKYAKEWWHWPIEENKYFYFSSDCLIDYIKWPPLSTWTAEESVLLITIKKFTSLAVPRKTLIPTIIILKYTIISHSLVILQTIKHVFIVTQMFTYKLP